MESCAPIAETVKYLAKRYGLKTEIMDFTGNSNIVSDPEGFALSLYSPSVKFMKTCIKSKNGFWTKGFNGTKEYIVPVTSENEVLGCIRLTPLGVGRRIEETIKEICPILMLFSAYIARKSFAGRRYGRVNRHVAMESEDFNGKNVMCVVDFIKNNYMFKITVRRISKSCHLCESYINHNFKKHMGINISAYINTVRIEHAKDYLMMSSCNVSEIALKVGFSDSNYFTRIFTKLNGIPPTQYRKKYAA